MRPIPAQNASSIGEELSAEVGRLVEACRRLWTAGVQHAHFTRHDLRHSEAILHQIGNWLGESTVRLNEYEVFVLVAAAYLHDIGMQCRSRTLLGQIPGLSASTMPFNNHELQILRSHHARLSYEMVRDACRIANDRRYPELGLDCTRYAPLYGAAALVCLGHVGPVESIPREVTEEYPFDRGPINLLLVQHLLRVGDALDATQGRVNHEYSTAAWSTLDARDKFHTLKHQYVASIDMDGVGVFRFNYSMPDTDKVHFALICAAAEESLRTHVQRTAHRLRRLNVPIYEVRSRLLEYDAPTTYPLEREVLELLSSTKSQPEPSTAHDTSSTSQRRPAKGRSLFDVDGRLDVHAFAFPIVDILARAARRMTRERRLELSAGDVLVGLCRRGPVTRDLLSHLGANADEIYHAATARWKGDSESRDFALVLDRNQMHARFLDVLSAAVTTVEQCLNRSDHRVYEEDLLRAFIVCGLWDSAVLNGLPDPVTTRQRLDEKRIAGLDLWRETISFDNLDESCIRVLQSAHVLAQQHSQSDIGQRILLAALLQLPNGLAARSCGVLGLEPREVVEPLLQSSFFPNLEFGISRHGTMSIRIAASRPVAFGLTDEACVRLVHPILRRARELAGATGKLTERHLLRAFADKAEPEFVASLAAPPLILDLHLLAEVDPDSPDTPFSQLDPSAAGIVRLAHALAQWLGHQEVSPAALLLAFLKMGNPETEVRRKLRRADRKKLEHTLRATASRRAAPTRIVFDPAASSGFVGSLIARTARHVAAGRDISASALFRELLEAQPPELCQLLAETGVGLDKLAGTLKG